jgi:hypothetical protein
LVDLLDRKALFLARVDRMRDPYEAALTRPTANAYREYFSQAEVMTTVEDVTRIQLQNLQAMRTQACISCWHGNTHESAAMWSLYSKSDECIAIRSTCSRMSATLAHVPEIVHIAQVSYINYDTQLFADGELRFSAFDAVTHKRLSFAHEAEVRLILWTHDFRNQKLAYGRQLRYPAEASLAYSRDGYELKLDLEQLIEAVYVSPTSSAWFHDLVARVLRRYDLPVAPIRSNLYDPPLR